jgi:uncharacterized protein YbjT (DUF2867 family)
MILVTGAAGKTGKAVIQALARRGATVRGLVRRNEQVPPIRAVGAQEVAVGDLQNRDDLHRVCRGVQAIYHICPNMHPNEVEIAKLVLGAAQANDVRRFVYHSVLHPQVEEMPHHWHKLRVEELLFKAGLEYTILQPAAYIQNVLAGWQTIVEQGIYRVPYAVETRLGMVDLADVAEVAARVLTEAGHASAIYELAGAEIFNQVEIAGMLAEVLGRPVRAEAVSLAEWERGARAAGLHEYAITTLRKMFTYYERYGFWGNSRLLTYLLGRPPATLRPVVMREWHVSIGA